MGVVQSEGSLVAAGSGWAVPPGYPTGVVNSGIGLYGERYADYAAIYRTQPNVRLVIGFLARNIAQLGIKPYRRVSDSERESLDRAHPLARVLRRPNPWTTKHRFVSALVHDLKLYDNAFALKARNREDGQMSLFRIPPYLVAPVGDNWLAPDGFMVYGPKSQPIFDRRDVVHLRGYNPSDARLGSSPLESLRRILSEEDAAGEWRATYWKSAARMSGVIERPLDAPKWSDTARRRFLSGWQSTYASGAELAGATGVLEEGMTWKPAAFSPKDSEYLGARRLSREEVASAYWVSPAMIGILENANFANIEQQHRMLYQDTLGPDLDLIEEDLELQVVSEWPDLIDEVYVEFNLAEKLKGAFEQRAQSLQASVGGPWLTRNEARAMDNRPPVDGGDELIVPLNVTNGGQASPQDSAPDSPPKAVAVLRPGHTPPTRAKGLEDLPEATRSHAETAKAEVERYFKRQQSVLLARLGAGKDLPDAWGDGKRWDEELASDLYDLAADVVSEVAPKAAADLGGTWNREAAQGWLEKSAEVAASKVNRTTYAALEDALKGSGSKGRKADDGEDDEEDDPVVLAGAVFAVALTSRAEQIATTRATETVAFGRKDGAASAGAHRKVWRINSSNARPGHPGDGETVDVEDTFSNGLRWPGDSEGDTDQTAGCTCSLDFEKDD